MSDPILDSVNRHERIIAELQQDMYQVSTRMGVMEERHDRTIEILSRIENKVDETRKEMKETQDWISQSKGGLRLGKWLAGTALGILGLGLAFVKFFKGGG